MNTRFTAVPHYCAGYFWLCAAKVWTQPFIILLHGKQLASFFSKQTPWDTDWSMLSCGLLAKSHYLKAAQALASTKAKTTRNPNVNHHNKSQLNGNYVKDLFALGVSQLLQRLLNLRFRECLSQQ